MNKIWKVVSFIGVVTLAFSATSIVFAQAESPQPYNTPENGPGMMGGKGRYGGGLVGGEEGPYHDVRMEIFAEALGLTFSQLDARLEGGETMWEIVEAEGFAWEEFWGVMNDARSAMLDQALEDGTITQEQAEFMSSRGQARGAGRGAGSCVGNEYGSQQGIQRGRQNRWNTP
jgi:hypothetical protein